jgi:2-amino-4-hydroxy-6-hydroxymethyldihydropteridine diphosphokinase
MMTGQELTYYLGLGSNLEDRVGNLKEAIRLIGERDVSILKRSSLYKTEPLDFTDQPYFYNCVLKTKSTLSPLELLEEIQAIEKKLGRQKLRDNGPRIIDIDILFAGDRVIRTESLTVPHPCLHMRNFVLRPLLEIAPSLLHPVLRKTIRRICREGEGKGEFLLLELYPGWP